VISKFDLTANEVRSFAAAVGLTADSTIPELRQAWRRSTMRFHPDQNQGDKAAEERFKYLNNIYVRLGRDLQHWGLAKRYLPQPEVKPEPKPEIKPEPIVVSFDTRRQFGIETDIPRGWREPGNAFLMEDILASMRATQTLENYEASFVRAREIKKQIAAFVRTRRIVHEFMHQAVVIASRVNISDRSWKDFQAAYGRRSAEYNEREEQLAWLKACQQDQGPNGIKAIRANLQTLKDCVGFVELGRSSLRGGLERMDGDEFQRALRKLERSVPGFTNYASRRARHTIKSSLANIRATLESPEWMKRYAHALQLGGVERVSFDDKAIQTAIDNLTQRQDEERAWLQNPSFKLKGLSGIQKILKGKHAAGVLNLLNVPPRTKEFLESLRDTPEGKPATIVFSRQDMASRTPPKLFDDLTYARLKKVGARIEHDYEAANDLRVRYDKNFAAILKAVRYMARRADKLVPTDGLRDQNGAAVKGCDVAYIIAHYLNPASKMLDALNAEFNHLRGVAQPQKPEQASNAGYSRQYGHG
jgi:hypothetical protein